MMNLMRKIIPRYHFNFPIENQTFPFYLLILYTFYFSIFTFMHKSVAHVFKDVVSEACMEYWSIA